MYIYQGSAADVAELTLLFSSDSSSVDDPSVACDKSAYALLSVQSANCFINSYVP